jgi:hypothetical protein
MAPERSKGLPRQADIDLEGQGVAAGLLREAARESGQTLPRPAAEGYLSDGTGALIVAIALRRAGAGGVSQRKTFRNPSLRVKAARVVPSAELVYPRAWTRIRLGGACNGLTDHEGTASGAESSAVAIVALWVGAGPPDRQRTSRSAHPGLSRVHPPPDAHRRGSG